MASPSSACSVKVGVRIRPMLAKERHGAMTITPETHSSSSISFKQQQYTFDHVFGMDLSQHELYVETAAPMLKSFLEGYNVTIMAYGQTVRSGKTFTMGTSELQEETELQGLIPRFVTDLFENIRLQNASSTEAEAEADEIMTTSLAEEGTTGKGARSQSRVLISFLEIYGEDVYDLIGTSRTTAERPSLPVREDETGHVFVQGQVEAEASSAREALELLSSGTRNRITASTAMNAGSSRSHAVFTITLEQTVQSSSSIAGVEDDAHRMTSKLTFVDLAGSERIKRTGAEGQRLKEGIQINSGLFNLGQVINALADDQRLKQGLKAQHVPYRNSKLTHLLKDALGGNSQTLFLACISPAESNESETHSTLNYARQARNIQNKPVKNMDKQQLELRRLKYAVKAWMIKAVGQVFGLSSIANSHDDTSRGLLLLSPLPSVSPAAKGGGREDEILRRADVQEYINAVNAAIHEKLQGGQPSPIRSRLSLGTPPRHAYSNYSRRGQAHVSHAADSVVQRLASTAARDDDRPLGVIREGEEEDGDFLGGERGGQRGGVFNTVSSLALREAALETKDPEETERLVSRMLEMVEKEKELYGQENREMEGAIEIVAVDKAIEEKEQILHKLMDTVKGYSHMKADFEKLLDAIGSLETERHELEAELERAKRAADTASQTGPGAANASSAVERIKERFLKVKKELEAMREERKNKENAYRLMQRESKQCDSLTKELAKLRESKVTMLKQQKAQAAHFQKRQREQQQKFSKLKNSDVKKQRIVNTLKSELVKKDRVLGHKDREIGRINSKLRACEDHIAQLLRIQNRNRARLTSANTPSGTRGSVADGARNSLPPAELEHLISSKTMLDSLIDDRVERHLIKRRYERKSAELQELNREMLSEALEMEALLARLRTLGVDEDGNSDEDEEEDEDDERVEERSDVRHSVRVCEANIDRISRELDLYNADLDDLSDRMEESSKKAAASASNKDGKEPAWEELGREIIASFSLGQCQPLIWDLLADKTDALEAQRASQEELSSIREQSESFAEKLAESERQLAACKADLKQRLERAELQRVQDVWAVLKASSCTSEQDESDPLAQTAIRAAAQRAQELEREMERFLAAEESAKAERAAVQAEMDSLRGELSAAQLRLQMIESAPDASNGDSNTGRQALAASFDECQSLWNELGLPAEERQAAITELKESTARANAKLLEDASESLDKAKSDILRYQADLQAVAAALGGSHEEYLSAERVAAFPKQLTPQIVAYEAALVAAEGDFKGKSQALCGLKERLLDLVAEMWLDACELPMALQTLMKVDCSTAESEPADLARHLVDVGLTLKEAQIQSWEGELRKLNLTRAQITTKLISLQADATALANNLGMLDVASLNELIGGGRGLGEEVSKQACAGAVELLVHPPASNPPGSQSLLKAAQNLFLLLKSVQVNRAAAVGHARKLTSSFTAEGSADTESAEVTGSSSSADDTHVYTKQDVLNVLFSLEEMCLSAGPNQAPLRAAIATIAAELRADGDIDKKIDVLLTVKAPPAVLLSMDQTMEQMGAMLLLDEAWLAAAIERAVAAWGIVPANADQEHESDTWRNAGAESLAAQSSGRESVRRCLVLRAEHSRLVQISDAHKELLRTDAQLTKHVVDMEDFEQQSKADRAKVLAGNSKLLIEEEKYRKNGKKKYELLAEKVLQTGSLLLHLARHTPDKADKADKGEIDVVLDLSQLSPQGQGLLKSKGLQEYKEKLELMHLHTTTHGTQRWSAGSDENADPESDRQQLPPAPQAAATSKTAKSGVIVKPPAAATSLPRPAARSAPLANKSVRAVNSNTNHAHHPHRPAVSKDAHSHTHKASAPARAVEDDVNYASV